MSHPRSRRGTGRWRRSSLAVALCTCAVAAAAIVPATASATAAGYQYFGTQTINGWTIPGGQLFHEINGSGYHINWDGANFGSVGNICDSSIRFTYGYGTWEYTGNVHWGCSHVGQWKYYFNWNAPGGKACAELWAEDWRVHITSQCHYIHG